VPEILEKRVVRTHNVRRGQAGRASARFNGKKGCRSKSIRRAPTPCNKKIADNAKVLGYLLLLAWLAGKGKLNSGSRDTQFLIPILGQNKPIPGEILMIYGKLSENMYYFF
jgi:hypothetical protein